MSNMKLLLILSLALSCSLARRVDYQADQALRPEECDDCVPGTKPQPAVAGSSAGAHHSLGIIGGQVANPGQFPWQAQVLTDNRVLCGGSIINEQWVLSAAHCASGFNNFIIVLGSDNLAPPQDTPNIIFVVSYSAIVHERYNERWLSDDISLISLVTPIQRWTSAISPVRLPSLSEASNTFSGWQSTVSGFGLYGDAQSVSPAESPVLRYVSMPVIDNAKCAQTFGAFIKTTNICTSGGSRTAPVSPCHGDSGGALVVYGLNKTATQVGIVSRGSVLGCNVGDPAVYTRVTSYLQWISTYSGLDISA